MLLKKLEVLNSQGSLLSLPLDDISAGFVVKDIQGLGPAKATLVSSNFSNSDGAQYHSGRLEPRNIVIKLGLVPDFAFSSVYDLRDQLYSYFMPKTQTLLKFNLFDKFEVNLLEQNLDLVIDGVVESFEVDQFTKEPTVDLSVMCFQPAFYDPEETIFNGFSVNDLTMTNIPYKGKIHTGFVFTIFPDRAVDEFVIYHKTSDNKLRSAYFVEALEADDQLKISSVRGDRYVTLIRDAVEYTRLYSLSPQSDWLMLEPGDNEFRVYAEGDPVPFTVEYNAKYGGL